MRINQRLLPALASVACMLVLAFGTVGRPAAAQPPEPGALATASPPGSGDTLAVVGGQSLRLPRELQAGSAVAPAALVLNEGFEGAWPGAGWQRFDNSQLDGGDYLWGKRNCHPRTGQYGMLSAGAGAQGNQRGCTDSYPNYTLTWAVYGPIDLSGATAAELIFRVWGRAEFAQGCVLDRMAVASSINNEDFFGNVLCGNFTNGPAGNGYYQLPLDLSNRLGQPQVWIGFIFQSDSSVTDIGYTIDDIELNVTGGAGPTNTPTRTATPTTTATVTPTRTPGELLNDRYIPIAVKALAPSPTATPTTQPTLTPTTQPGGKPRDGHWSGSTSQGKDVGFDVLSGGTRYNAFEIGVQSGGCGVSLTITSGSGGFPIANNQFTLSGSSSFGGSYVFAGTFSSPSSASGTFSFNGYNTGACSISSSGTWQASHP